MQTQRHGFLIATQALLIAQMLRGRARSVALKRLKQSRGTMALEHQAPEADVFKQLLEKRTDEILTDRREKLWQQPADD
ncbi:MAG: hypothetical protein ACREQ2_15505 [Candidatus Binatia bacterium]